MNYCGRRSHRSRLLRPPQGYHPQQWKDPSKLQPSASYLSNTLHQDFTTHHPRSKATGQYQERTRRLWKYQQRPPGTTRRGSCSKSGSVQTNETLHLPPHPSKRRHHPATLPAKKPGCTPPSGSQQPDIQTIIEVSREVSPTLGRRMNSWSDITNLHPYQKYGLWDNNYLQNNNNGIF